MILKGRSPDIKKYQINPPNYTPSMYSVKRRGKLIKEKNTGMDWILHFVFFANNKILLQTFEIVLAAR